MSVKNSRRASLGRDPISDSQDKGSFPNTEIFREVLGYRTDKRDQATEDFNRVG